MTMDSADKLKEIMNLFGVYREKQSQKPNKPQTFGRFAIEVTDRLEQLKIILEQIQSIEIDLHKDLQKPTKDAYQIQNLSRLTEQERINYLMNTREEFNEKWERFQKLYLYTECFYYIAFRCGRVLEQLPGLETIGYQNIKIIRNQLIEHSEGQGSLIISRSIGWGEPEGPRIKNSRDDNESRDHQDKGLYINLDQFLNSFKSLLFKNL